MKRKGFLLNIHNWLVKQAESSDLDYKLISSDKLIGLLELKNAHRDLLSEYANALATLSRLSFFVSLYEVYKAKKPPSIRRFIFYLINKYTPIRLVTLKPLVNLFVEYHIKSKLRELKIAYTQLKSMLPDYHSEREKYVTWISNAIEECDSLTKTLSSWGIVADFTKLIVNTFVGVIISRYGAEILSFSIAKALSAAQIQPATPVDIRIVVGNIAFFVLLALYSTIFIDPSFRMKREIFLGLTNKDERNIYTAENNLFDLLKRGKTKEFPLDYMGLTISIVLLFVFLFAAKDSVKRIAQSNINSNVFVCNIFPLLISLLTIGFVIIVAIPIYKRRQSRLM